jgi:hypothetical protein
LPGRAEENDVNCTQDGLPLQVLAPWELLAMEKSALKMDLNRFDYVDWICLT